MKLIKNILIVAFTTVIIISACNPVNAKVIGMGTGNVSTLNYQLYNEIKSIVDSPVSPYYINKYLKGETDIMFNVSENGKVNIIKIKGENETLNNMIVQKIRTLNLWTDKKYAGALFQYKIKSS